MYQTLCFTWINSVKTQSYKVDNSIIGEETGFERTGNFPKVTELRKAAYAEYVI